MSNTKENILEQSLKLFNERGLSNVSLRTVADELNISVGNLQYHFKKREHIIEALYFQLVKKIDTSIVKSSTLGGMLQSFFNITQSTLLSFFEYRFFLLDFTLIIRQHEKIRAHYKELIKVREQQFFNSLTLLIENGFLREEILPSEYKNLFIRLQILSDFWASSASIHSEKISKNMVLEYSQVINQSIFPYLTEKGRIQYLKKIES
ncbi:TetR/AcrR family transcriptional regulator [Rapidithrix thailandica]|uniref:TetR/AcrR family transcriptional regulator n=1 Tax=Rapidithrix thailandica TaxID=413964 RepID=A0AAW9SC43_9BACT